jgi:hypothetical protein
MKPDDSEPLPHGNGEIEEKRWPHGHTTPGHGNIATAKRFFRWHILIAGDQRAAPSKPHRARLAVSLQNEITLDNGYNTNLMSKVEY